MLPASIYYLLMNFVAMVTRWLSTSGLYDMYLYWLLICILIINICVWQKYYYNNYEFCANYVKSVYLSRTFRGNPAVYGN